jgi:hypothetical protein
VKRVRVEEGEEGAEEFYDLVILTVQNKKIALLGKRRRNGNIPNFSFTQHHPSQAGTHAGASDGKN